MSKSSLRARPRTQKLAFEALEARHVLTGPFGAMTQDTGEYMLGTVLVNVVLMESNGTFDANSETWTPTLVNDTKLKVEASLQWWKDTLVATGGGANPLNFIFDYTYANAPVDTGYEPIANISDYFELWIQDFFTTAHQTGGANFSENIYNFNSAQRTAHNADWAFTLFVVNSENDFDDRFEIGGSFTGAFAFAGGQFAVVPSGRPVSSFTHEVGHMFWAFDEYAGGKDYTDYRGYYNTQNLNAYDLNPNLGSRSDSIMSNGNELLNAFDHNTSPASTLEMIGWKDSDNDGLFDVIDVPHLLTGYGSYDSFTGTYHFTGTSSVQTLPNQNPSPGSLQNDITINRLSRAEYRVDGGSWITGQSLGNTPQASLDFTFGALAPGNHTIEVRTVDDRTGVVSNIFSGNTAQPSNTAASGINGYVWNDQNVDGLFTANEPTYANWTVQLFGPGFTPLNLSHVVEPDNYAQDTVLNAVIPEVTLTAIGSDVTSNQVIARDRTPSSTGTKVFTHQVASGISASWTQSSRQLRMDFTQPITTLSLDAVGNSDFDYGRLEIYDAAGNLLGRYTTGSLSNGAVETMTLSRPQGDIKYAIAKGHAGTAVSFDHLTFGPETSATTNNRGAYSLPNLPAGTYMVQLLPPVGYNATSPTGGEQSISLSNGETRTHVDFGARSSSGLFLWHNTAPYEAADVNRSGLVTNLDAFLIITELRNHGAHALEGAPGNPAYYYDVNPDETINNLDAFVVIAALRAQTPEANGGGGEGLMVGVPDPLANNVSPPAQGSSSEGEANRSLPPLLQGQWADTFDERPDAIVPTGACTCATCLESLHGMLDLVASSLRGSAAASSLAASLVPLGDNTTSAASKQSESGAEAQAALDAYFAQTPIEAPLSSTPGSHAKREAGFGRHASRMSVESLAAADLADQNEGPSLHPGRPKARRRA